MTPLGGDVGGAPLMQAMWVGHHLESVQLLLDAGAPTWAPRRARLDGAGVHARAAGTRCVAQAPVNAPAGLGRREALQRGHRRGSAMV